MPLCCCSDLPIPLLPSVLTIQNCPRPGSYPEASQYQNVHALQATTANLTKGLLQRLLKSGGYLLLTCTFLRDHQCLSLVAPNPKCPSADLQESLDTGGFFFFFFFNSQGNSDKHPGLHTLFVLTISTSNNNSLSLA